MNSQVCVDASVALKLVFEEEENDYDSFYLALSEFAG